MPNDLQNVFGFKESDLLSNQNGQLSEKQLKEISQYRKMHGCFGRLAFIVMFISVGSIAGIGLYNVGSDLEKNLIPILAFLGVFSFGMLVIIFFLLLGKIRSDLKSGKVSTVEGVAELSHKKMPRQLGTAYYLTIGKVRFQLNSKAKFDAFETGKIYRVFYIKHPPTQIILSVTETLSRC